MIYYHTDISKVNRDLWRGYVRELDYSFDATTRGLAEHTAYRVVEETTGHKSFSVIFTDH